MKTLTLAFALVIGLAAQADNHAKTAKPAAAPAAAATTAAPAQQVAMPDAKELCLKENAKLAGKDLEACIAKKNSEKK